MIGYSTNEVAELVGMPPDKVRGFARAGLLSAADGHGSHERYKYSFQDVVLLRMAKELEGAYVSPKLISGTLHKLKARLPQGKPISAVRVMVRGDEVLVREQDALWHPDSGQMELDFSLSSLTRNIAPLVKQAAHSAVDDDAGSADDWYNLGIDLEMVEEAAQARDAYHRAIALDPAHADAYVNLGRLEHGEGENKRAADCFREAIAINPDHANAWFNLGVALEALRIRDKALEAYEMVVSLKQDFPDVHYNLAHLYEESGNLQAAVRHLSAYKKLSKKDPA